MNRKLDDTCLCRNQSGERLSECERERERDGFSGSQEMSHTEDGEEALIAGINTSQYKSFLARPVDSVSEADLEEWEILVEEACVFQARKSVAGVFLGPWRDFISLLFLVAPPLIGASMYGKDVDLVFVVAMEVCFVFGTTLFFACKHPDPLTVLQVYYYMIDRNR